MMEQIIRDEYLVLSEDEVRDVVATDLTFGLATDIVGNTNPALLLGYYAGVNSSNGYLASGTNFGVFLTAPNAMSVTGPNYLYINSTKVGNLVDMYLPRGAANLGGGNAGMN